MFTLQHRTYALEPRRFETLAAAGHAMLDVACSRWVVKRAKGRPLQVDGHRQRLVGWGLYVVERREGATLEHVATEYAFLREKALRLLLEDAARKTWPGTPAAPWYVIELKRSRDNVLREIRHS